jgi:hypothetical protein
MKASPMIHSFGFTEEGFWFFKADATARLS